MAKKAKSAAIPTPQSFGETDAMIGELGEKQRLLAELQTELDREVAAAKRRFELGAAGIKADINGLQKGIQTWCEGHRAEICKGGRKTVDFPAGKVSWRATPPKVTLKNVANIIAEIRKRRLDALFLRIKTEVDKEALLKHAEKAVAIPGVAIAGGEQFVIEPVGLQLAPGEEAA